MATCFPTIGTILSLRSNHMGTPPNWFMRLARLFVGMMLAAHTARRSPPDHCVVSHGDIELVSKIHNEKRWRPGAFATIENYYCSNYVNHFGEYWLNRDYLMLPFGDLKRQKQLLFDTFGIDGRIFARPDSPLKLFTGQTASLECFDADVEYMGFYEFPVRSLVVVSSPKTIQREWRFVAANRYIVAGCLYCESGQFASKPQIDDDAKQLAQKIASSGYEPDPVWIVDICQTSDGEYHLLESVGSALRICMPVTNRISWTLFRT